MRTYPARRHVRRVEVTDEIATSRRHHYADAFMVQLRELDREAPATWVLEGLNDVPIVVERIASLLGMDDETPSDPLTETDGWRVIQSTPELVHLERSIPLMDVLLVGRNVGWSGRVFTSVLIYRRPVLARMVWAVVGIGHRRMARRLVAGMGSASPARRAVRPSSA